MPIQAIPVFRMDLDGFRCRWSDESASTFAEARQRCGIARSKTVGQHGRKPPIGYVLKDSVQMHAISNDLLQGPA
jgi:hypothetical protein